YEPKAPFAIAEEEKETLLKDLQAEVNRQLKEAYPAGITAREKVETKLVQVLESVDLDIANSVIAGTSELDVQQQKDFMDDKMVFFSNPEEAKTQLIDGGLIDAEARYIFTLQALDTYVLESLVIQLLAKAENLDVQIMSHLLKKHLSHPSDQNRSALNVFLDENFTEADPALTWTSAELPDPFALTEQLHKLVLVITTLKFHPEHLTFLMEKGTAAGLPDLRQLPLSTQASVSTGLAGQWIALCKIVLLDKEISRGDRSVFTLLDAAQDPNSTEETLLTALSEDT